MEEKREGEEQVWKGKKEERERAKRWKDGGGKKVEGERECKKVGKEEMVDDGGEERREEGRERGEREVEENKQKGAGPYE